MAGPGRAGPGRAGSAVEDVVSAALTAVGGDLLPGLAPAAQPDPGTWEAVAPALTQGAVDRPGAPGAGLAEPAAAASAAVLCGAALLMSTEDRRSVVATAVERPRPARVPRLR